MPKRNMRKRTGGIIKVGDPNAKAMWGRCRHQVFRDKTKYTRKTKHKKQEEEYYYGKFNQN